MLVEITLTKWSSKVWSSVQYSKEVPGKNITRRWAIAQPEMLSFVKKVNFIWLHAFNISICLNFLIGAIPLWDVMDNLSVIMPFLYEENVPQTTSLISDRNRLTLPTSLRMCEVIRTLMYLICILIKGNWFSITSRDRRIPRSRLFEMHIFCDREEYRYIQRISTLTLRYNLLCTCCCERDYNKSYQ